MNVDEDASKSKQEEKSSSESSDAKDNQVSSTSSEERTSVSGFIMENKNRQLTDTNLA